MSLKYGKREISAIAKVLDQDYDSAEDAALACLEAMEGIFRDRAKFVVVGQLRYSRETGLLDSSSPEAIKVALGWYSTEGDAKNAAYSLWHNTASGDEFRTWYLDVFHGTPAELHAKRKEQYVALESKRREAADKAMEKFIEAQRERARQHAEEWRQQEAIQEPYPCTRRTIEDKACLHTPTCK